MTRYTYYTASSIDGFIATEDDSLDWLLKQPQGTTGPGGNFDYEKFIQGIGALVMGATTYEWVLKHGLEATGETWPYPQPTFVFTHRELPLAADNVQLVAGTASDHRAALEAAAGDKDVWIVGGGDLAEQFAAAGMLQEMVVTYAPVTLGSGRPLFTGRRDLELVDQAVDGVFLSTRFAVT